ncbi:NfeD family protein [Aquabacterium sp. A08]|uniref:NfeD family protein n=1 Tax=Aquabacterium sp. A08 TaxID=2718532 RepID=UPI0014239C15|nr:NfeD family protein [Aquabacterium sp. A08]NIC41878.1 NfeD family protein [Aquabacterium sp. A08]
MDESTVWWLLAGGAVALELVTGTFFLLMLAVGLAAGALAAHAGADPTLQLVVAALVGGGAVVGWQRWRLRRRPTARASENRDVNLDIGETVQVQQWQSDGTARVRYRGAEWTVALQNPLPLPGPGAFRVVSVHGNRLIVRAV